VFAQFQVMHRTIVSLTITALKQARFQNY